MKFSATALLSLIAVSSVVCHSATAVAQRDTSVPAIKELALPATDEGLPGAGPIRRQEWFQNLWIQRRSEWYAEKANDENAVVFLGDSITQGWGNHLADSFPKVKVANRGISGDTTRGMLIRLEEDVLSLDPCGIVMLMGTNDLGDGAEPEIVAANLRLILKKIHDHDSEIPVILCAVFPSSSSKQRSADAIQKLNAEYLQVAREFEQVVMLDTYTLFANSEGDAKVEEFPDLLHPNLVGYHKWRDSLTPVLETLGLSKFDDTEFEPEDGFRSLFNATDLTGWGYLPTPPQNPNRKRNTNAPARTVVEQAVEFDGKTATPDGRYVAKNGRLIVTIPAEGRRIQQLWTTETFPSDFTLRLQFRATPNADSGIFLRQPQLQCRDYLLAGPYTELKKYRPLQWNDIEVKVTGNTAYCTCNGEVLEAEFQLPDDGPIGLEGDRGQMEYRHMRISE